MAREAGERVVVTGMAFFVSHVSVVPMEIATETMGEGLVKYADLPSLWRSVARLFPLPHLCAAGVHRPTAYLRGPAPAEPAGAAGRRLRREEREEAEKEKKSVRDGYVGGPMENTRRAFLRYLPPAILTLAALPAFAGKGSGRAAPRNERRGQQGLAITILKQRKKEKSEK